MRLPGLAAIRGEARSRGLKLSILLYHERHPEQAKPHNRTQTRLLRDLFAFVMALSADHTGPLIYLIAKMLRPPGCSWQTICLQLLVGANL